MRIVCWNMGCAGPTYRRNHESAWQYLLDVLKPDIALVQEALLVPPTCVAERGQVLLRRSYGSQDWGSGVFVKAGTSLPREVSLLGTYLAAADVTVAEHSQILAVSAHVCPDKKQRQYLHELVDFLRPLLTDRRVIVAGDFNAARLYDEVHGKNEYRWFFEELRGMGLHDCHWELHHREDPSCWPTRGTRYQTDHVFVDQVTARQIRSCEVIADSDRTNSDHAPLLLVLADEDAAQQGAATDKAAQ